jgi:hypothetical protein
MGFFTSTELGGAAKAGAQFASGSTRAAEERANESIATEQAESEMKTGAYNANITRQRGAQVVGSQIAAIGGNNLQQGGTPAQVVANTAAANERNTLTVQNNALRRAWGFEVQGASDAFQAKQDEEGGILSGIGTLASTGGSLYKMSNTPSGGY